MTAPAEPTTAPDAQNAADPDNVEAPEEGVETETNKVDRALARIKAQRDEIRTKYGDVTAERDQLAKELQEFRDKNLTELELAKRDKETVTQELERLRKEASDFQLKGLRQQVALDKGLPASLVGMLQGSDQEEIEAYADALLDVIKKQSRPDVKPDASQGPRGGGTATPQQQFAAAMRDLL